MNITFLIFISFLKIKQTGLGVHPADSGKKRPSYISNKPQRNILRQGDNLTSNILNRQ